MFINIFDLFSCPKAAVSILALNSETLCIYIYDFWTWQRKLKEKKRQITDISLL